MAWAPLSPSARSCPNGSSTIGPRPSRCPRPGCRWEARLLSPWVRGSSTPAAWGWGAPVLGLLVVVVAPPVLGLVVAAEPQEMGLQADGPGGPDAVRPEHRSRVK